jgi:hypothetical protein
MLNYLNNRFINSEKKTKIELFLFPIFLGVLIFLYFNEQKQTNQIVQKIDNYSFENRKLDENILEISLKIENFAKENSIFIIKNEKKESEIFLLFSGNLNDIFNFFEKIENLNSFSKISFVNFRRDNLKNIVSLRVDFSNFFIKKLKEKREKIILKDSFEIVENKEEIKEIETDEIDTKLSEEDFVLSAIIGDFAQINGNLYRKNELVENYKIIKIYRDFVILKDKNHEIKVYLKHAKYIKNLD